MMSFAFFKSHARPRRDKNTRCSTWKMKNNFPQGIKLIIYLSLSFTHKFSLSLLPSLLLTRSIFFADFYFVLTKGNLFCLFRSHFPSHMKSKQKTLFSQACSFFFFIFLLFPYEKQFFFFSVFSVRWYSHFHPKTYTNSTEIHPVFLSTL